MDKGISVIICCYNSAERLPETLRHLAGQRFTETIPVEIILINNASTDTTKETAQSEWERYGSPFPMMIINENRAGVIYARQTGIKHASYKYTLWCDDDNWLKYNYMQLAFDRMESDPTIGVLGGQSTGVSLIDLPDWFLDYSAVYAIGKQAQHTGFLHQNYIWGAASVQRTAIVIETIANDFPMLLVGRKGNLLLAGDDSEMCRRILLMGYRLFYDEALHFSHFIPPARLTKEYREGLRKGIIQSTPILGKYDILLYFSRLNRPAQLKNIAVLAVRILFRRLFHPKQVEEIAMLHAKTCFLFNTTRWSKDIEYNIILNFYFTYRK
ncbi:MAG: glycosyltransferase family 2 protein [Candidatus Symbiothrix sp.]|jgi:glycosyltransferase involved in cell wall biosynthesis|nr:glycosyltransferase family 2 protein [Candidatus Symbiothrix sp.]